MKTLCLFANEFPFGTWEPYLETEYQYYSKFEKVWICSLQLRKEHCNTIRSLNGDPIIIPVNYLKRSQYLIGSLRVLFDDQLYKELIWLIRNKKLTIHNIVRLFVFLSRSHHEARVIDKALYLQRKDNIVFYSYRFEYQPYVAILLRKTWNSSAKIICRAHGYDLYENLRDGDYIPLRNHILNNVDKVFTCSKNGELYLKSKYPGFKDKIMTSYLGTNNYGIGPSPFRNGSYHLISCSRTVSIKQIDRIIDALALIDGMKIKWSHYGDGPLLNDLKQYALEKLPSNIDADFCGYIENCNLMKIYEKQSFDLFLNISKSEGIPVSIMEAMSFGIPCIATKVGGTEELVDETNGMLVSADISAKELSEIIKSFLLMPQNDYMKFRKKARNKWQSKFNSEENYTLFIDELL